MGAAYFYHLTRAPLAQTLPMLLGKSLQAGWRVVVRGQDEGMMQALDLALWKGAEDSFLPHGLAGGAHDAQQPVLLGHDVMAEANGASCLMSVGGAAVTAEEVAALDRVCILFDGLDEMAVDHARSQWKALTGAGCAAQYWSEESGRWEKKAETGS
ncbi:DNA polymerase III subunit chi [Thalassovita mediterranea]|jgi:DNA polymerase-3 subunit chi|uniref:DNA polymerase III subunit chi n=1 Tax=Thalassovita mediterranea TaxID=340021 RepID=A0A0P1GLL8_9RHOB|nr:DNA polymerase III subunit chi [Thalassovita mediterranea]CUH83226.1 DNA polymerase III subunit chi [Thalassovita mediterranea]SIS33557.1 DNA polymerase III, chi subunit [Thalassovita mediterranea]